MKQKNNLKETVKSLWHSLFYGMAAADTVITSPVGSSDSQEIVQQARSSSVYSDLLNQQETQRVKEVREKYYRILREAEKVDTSKIKIVGDVDSGDWSFEIPKEHLRKKSLEDFKKHSDVLNKENYPIRTIQDNKHMEKHNTITGYNGVFDPSLLPKGLYDYDTTLSIERDGFTPRFEIEKFVTKIVVREKPDGRALVDLYLPLIPSQFGKIDAILISNLHQLRDEKIMKSDLTDVMKFKWFSDRAWNVEDMCLFEFDDVKYTGIDVFDGSFVLTFDCNPVHNGKDLVEKFFTKEMDEKYKNNAPKSDTIDLFTLQRHINKKEEQKGEVDLDNLSSAEIKLD